ncbi:MAG: DUF4404 family protein [Elusimicrobia bacterium]|nr:DUF4404 family protein [Elusimicrobiota bacterium]
MIKDTLAKIEAAIARIDAADGKNKTELLALLNRLKKEVAGLPESCLGQANSVANFVQAAAHEATRGDADARMQEISRQGLSHSARRFEASHPVLVGIVDDICRMLAQIGI